MAARRGHQPCEICALAGFLFGARDFRGCTPNDTKNIFRVSRHCRVVVFVGIDVFTARMVMSAPSGMLSRVTRRCLAVVEVKLWHMPSNTEFVSSFPRAQYSPNTT